MTPTSVERVVNAARISVAQRGVEVRLQLHPESLGEVRVLVRWESGALNARLEAATPLARETLENGAHYLRAALEDQGIPVERLSVELRMDLNTLPSRQELGSPEEGRAPSNHSSAFLEAPGEESVEPLVGSTRIDIRI